MITSAANKNIREIIGLMKRASHRKASGCYVAEGIKMFEELPDKNIQKISKSNYSSSSSEEKTINRIITDKDLKNNKKEEEDREDRFEEITDRTNRITALGSAMGAVDLSKTPANKFRVGAGVGQSAKNQAVAVGIGYAPTERLRLNTKISTTTNSTGSNRSNGISIGASYDLDW